jgi:hypothetical protein
MVVNFMFVCNPQKLQMWQSKLSTYSCFHPFNFDQIEFYFLLFVWWWQLWQLSLCNMFLFMALIVLFFCYYLWPWLCYFLVVICDLGFALLLLVFMVLVMLFYYCYLWPWSCSFVVVLGHVLLLLSIVLFCYFF